MISKPTKGSIGSKLEADLMSWGLLRGAGSDVSTVARLIAWSPAIWGNVDYVELALSYAEGGLDGCLGDLEAAFRHASAMHARACSPRAKRKFATAMTPSVRETSAATQLA